MQWVVIVQIDFNLISFTLSFVSLFVSLFAVIQAWMIKREADRVNDKTTQVLIDIRAHAEAITKYAIPELTKYGEASRQVMLGVTMSTTNANITMTDTVPGNISEVAVENEGCTDAVDR